VLIRKREEVHKTIEFQIKRLEAIRQRVKISKNETFDPKFYADVCQTVNALKQFVFTGNY
jgi:hypothetical protein